MDRQQESCELGDCLREHAKILCNRGDYYGEDLLKRAARFLEGEHVMHATLVVREE